MDPFIVWLTATPLSQLLQAQIPWVWPLSETLHFVGLSLFIGIVGFFDLRLLGVIRRVSVRAVADLLPWAMAGFVVNLITGMVFLIAQPGQYAASSAFWAKAFFLLIGGLNIVLFEIAFKKKAYGVQEGEDPPLSCKVFGAVSLVAWSGVLFFGRMLPYIGAPEGAGF